MTGLDPSHRVCCHENLLLLCTHNLYFLDMARFGRVAGKKTYHEFYRTPRFSELSSSPNASLRGFLSGELWAEVGGSGIFTEMSLSLSNEITFQLHCIYMSVENAA